jgi:hypothetical protein
LTVLQSDLPMIVVGACGVFDQDASRWGVNWLTASGSLPDAGVMVPLLRASMAPETVS